MHDLLLYFYTKLLKLNNTEFYNLTRFDLQNRGRQTCFDSWLHLFHFDSAQC